VPQVWCHEGRTAVGSVLPDDLLLVMLKVYLDRGEKHDEKSGDGDRIMCAVATVFKPVPYKQFVRPSNRMLRAWGASEFHATDFYPGAKEFERKISGKQQLFQDDCRRIPTLIAGHVHRVTVVAFRPGEFAERASPKWKKQFGVGVHSVAVQLCMLSLGWWREANCPSEHFAYFHDSGDPEEARVLEVVGLMKENKEYNSVLQARSFTMVDKGTARGLEASDFVAWHWNKHYIEKLKLGDEVPRKDFAAFMKLSEKKFRAHL
jgi:hypothetical protein